MTLPVIRAALVLLVIAGTTLSAPLANAEWGYAEDLLSREAGYIVDCSYTTEARNKTLYNPESDAYGCFNNLRLEAALGPSWVVSSENAVGVIGLMKATRVLSDSLVKNAAMMSEQEYSDASDDIDKHETVIDAFFDHWVIGMQPIVETGADAGGVVERVYYDAFGSLEERDNANSGSTGIMMVAMYKRYEFLRDTGRPEEALMWLANENAWGIMNNAYDFLYRNYNEQYEMVRSRHEQRNLWITDATLAACGTKCFYEWALKTNRSTDGAMLRFTQLKHGVERMKDDDGDWKNFYRFRDLDSNNQDNRSYGDRLDQLCHLPYEAGLLPPEDGFAVEISDWWTNGSPNSPRMTFPTDNMNDWKYFGTHWKYFFNPSGPEEELDNRRLYPGPSLQLAKLEWRTGKALGNSTLIARANNRFKFVSDNERSGLWFGSNGGSEAGVPNGIVDWRNADDESTAPDALRFVDTSSYMIQVTLMVFFELDTVYLPQTASPIGDVNLDGVVNFLDVSPFIAVLASGVFQAQADCDGNGEVNFLDISPFIAILSGSQDRSEM